MKQVPYFWIKIGFMIASSRVFLLIRLVSLSLMVYIGLSWPLWFEFQNIPQIPVLSFLPVFTPVVQQALVLVTLLSLALIGVFPKSRFPWSISFLLVLITCFQDWNRIQPWLVQALGVLLLLVPFQRSYRKYESLDHYGFALKLTFAGLYFWSGYFKVNADFETLVVPFSLAPLTNYLVGFKSTIHQVGALAPYFEMFMALLILLPKSINWSVYLLTFYHFIILLLFGMSSIPIDQGLLIWNLTLILSLWLVLWNNTAQLGSKFIFKTPRITWLAIAVFVLFPLLNKFNIYNKNTAFEVFSGNNFINDLKIPLNEVSHISTTIEPFSFSHQDSLHVRTYDLFLDIYGTAPNPDPKVMHRLNRELSQQMR